jgi:phosphopantothenoylcysteine decarboxylase/phosphopantothenate--cysteine ligase
VSAIDMFEAIKDIYQDFDIIIMNAAVADFRPKVYSENKLKKTKENPTVELQPNPDILKFLGESKKENQILIGFAAESENIFENAIDKLKRKNLDVIIANPVKVFSKDIYEGYIIFKYDRKIEIKTESKEKASYLILDGIFNK